MALGTGIAIVTVIVIVTVTVTVTVIVIVIVTVTVTVTATATATIAHMTHMEQAVRPLASDSHRSLIDKKTSKQNQEESSA